MSWSPAQYEKFKSQRSKPFFDLMALVEPTGVTSVVDLGCGTGELTRKLFDKLHPQSLLGIDSSREMLAKSAPFETPGLSFELREIARFTPTTPLDLVFSNAALHWLPDHEALFQKLLGWVKPGGQVAVQMPQNFDHPSHRIAREAATELYPDAFPPGHELSGTLSVERYAELLFRAGFHDQHCRVEVYGHPMPSGSEVAEWTKGSLLTAYQERLSESQFSALADTYRRKLINEIGEGPYFYAFKRILFWGKKSAN